MNEQSMSTKVINGRYALRGELGRGGMGIVWRAEDMLIGRQVAVKQLSMSDGLDERERAAREQRLLREARSAGRLNNPATVTVHDVLQEEHRTYIVMELVEGSTLAETLHRVGPLPPAQVVAIARQLLAALDEAHALGIVHRDVKPANILLMPDGRVKLTDFGIAVMPDEPGLTSSGILLGSVAYLAPERLDGQDANAASDLWSLGATLFHLVEGRNPFARTSTLATMRAILKDAPRCTRVDGLLADVIDGLLIADPAARLTSAQVRASLDRGTAPASAMTVVPASRDHAGSPPGGTPNAAVSSLNDHNGRARGGVDAQQPARSPKRWRTVLIGTTVAVASAAAVVAAVTLLPGSGRSDGDTATQQQPPPTEQVRIPSGFVPPPTRPTPLPNPVTCEYQPDGKTPAISVTPPVSGEVPSQGIVRATINTNIGALPAILDRSLAPCMVNSFIHLAKQDFYDNTGCVSGNVPFLSCGPNGSPGYTSADENFPGLRNLRGHLTMIFVYYPEFTLFFEDSQSDETVFGTISDEGMHVIDTKLAENDDTYNNHLRDITVTSIDIQE